MYSYDVNRNKNVILITINLTAFNNDNLFKPFFYEQLQY